VKKRLLFVCLLGLSAMQVLAQTHFQTVYTGNPYLAMNFYITSAAIDDVGLEAGDEIGIYNGEYCVGAAIVEGNIDPYLAMVAGTDDPGTPEIDGFTPGHSISYRLWDSNQIIEITDVAATYAMGNGNFVSQGTAMAGLDGSTSTTGPNVVHPILDITLEEDAMGFDVADLDTVFFNPVPEDLLTYTITNGNPNVQLSIVNGSIVHLELSANWNGSASITITASNSNSESVDDIFELTVNSVNDAPELALISDQNSVENGSVVVPVSGIDVDFELDPNEALTFTVSDNSNESLVAVTINDDNLQDGSAELVLTAQPDQHGSSTITVLVVDNGGLTDTRQFVFTVYSLTQTHFQTVYTGNPYLAMNFYITSAAIDDVGLEAGDEIGIYDGEYCVGAAIVEGNIDPYLAMVAGTDDPGTPEIDGFTPGHTISYRLWDANQIIEITDVAATYAMGNGNFVSQGTAMAGLDGNSIPPEPSLVHPIQDLNIEEDAAGLDIADLDTVFFNPSVEELLTYTISNGESNLQLSLADVSILHLELSPDWNGSAEIIITASNSSSQSVADTFEVSVSPVNDAPVLADISAQSTAEETAINVALNASDIDEDDLTYSAASDTSGVIVSVSGSTLTLTPQLNFAGEATITVMVSDGSLTDEGSFVLTVSPVNDAPVLADISTQEISEDNELSIVLSAEDFDGDDLSYSAISADANVSVLVSNDSLYLTPAANWNGSSVITVTVDDGSGSDNATDTGSFTLSVTPVNDAPQVFGLIYPGNELLIDNPDSVALTFSWEAATDVDGDLLVYGLRVFDGSNYDSLLISEENQFRLNIEEFPRNVWLNWEVWVTDNQDTVWSSSSFTLMVDGVVGIRDRKMIPEEFVLQQNYPNPFNPSTTLRYGLPDDVTVSLVIYDIRGNLVKTFAPQSQVSGWYECTWNGIDDSGQPVSTGLYITKIQAGSFTRTIKMLYLK